ncbi:transposase family protein [Streptomyces sp. NPDC002669]|uniref:transposase family protein n=1 Tax=Streptomyces sp. NPDC002669 TaxID=3364658 RepID=UPI00369A2D44
MVTSLITEGSGPTSGPCRQLGGSWASDLRDGCGSHRGRSVARWRGFRPSEWHSGVRRFDGLCGRKPRRPHVPDCGRRSSRMHCYHPRALADRSVAGKRVRLELRARQFVCGTVNATGGGPPGRYRT